MSFAIRPSARNGLSSLLLASILLGGCAGSTPISEQQITSGTAAPAATQAAAPAGDQQAPTRSSLVVPTSYQGQAPAAQTAERQPRSRSPAIRSSGAVNVDISGDISRSYIVFGREYYVLSDAAGYHETGIASWYGPNFHGKQTASGEIYNQYGITAAHRTLPLNSRVWVVNLRNNRAIEVRINDRGPFAKNRLIDLSYGAAWALDVVGSGVVPVLLKVASLRQIQSFGVPVNFDAGAAKEAAEKDKEKEQEITREGQQQRGPRQQRLDPPEPGDIRYRSPPLPAEDRAFFVQLGAWSSRENAERNFDLVRESFSRVLLKEKPPELPDDVVLYRLLLGPYQERSEAQEVLELMKAEGFEGAFIRHSVR